jgi:glycosyltransferase involved in cell wall biosynthesis
MIRLSVVIPTFEAGPLLAEAVRSVTAGAREDVETVVVDDGSTDGSADAVAASPGVVVIRQPNRGPGAARNQGLALARGEIVGFLDADDAWLPGRVAALLTPGTAESGLIARADLVYSDYLVRSLRTGDVRRHACPPLAPPVATALALHNPICTSTVVARRAALLAAGGFREDLRFAEDWDLWLRVAERGPVAHVATPWAEHRERPGSLAEGNLEALHHAGEVVLAAAIARAPELYGSIARRARANLDLRSGVRAQRAGDVRMARRHLARAASGGRLRPTLKLLAATLFAKRGPAPSGSEHGGL